MRIRLLKPINTSVGEFDPGEVLDINAEAARRWISEGKAMEDKAYAPKKRKNKRKRLQKDDRG